MIPAPYTDNSYKWAGGGFLSTPEDLVRYGSACLGDKFLRPETVKLLFTPQRTRDGKETPYGFHWMIKKDNAGRTIVSHGGGAEDGQSHLVIYPEQRVVVSMLINLAEIPGPIVEKTEAVAQIFMPTPAAR